MKFTNIFRYQLPLAQVLLYAALLLRLRGVGRRCRCYEALPQPVYKRCHGVLWRVPSFQHTVGTLLTLRFVFRGTHGFTAARGSLVQRQERRCLWSAPQLLSALSLLSERCPGVPRCVPSLPHAVSTLWTLQCIFGGTLGFTAALKCLVQRQVFVGYFLSTFGPLLGLWPMLWGAEACPKLVTRCGHTVDPSMHL